MCKFYFFVLFKVLNLCFLFILQKTAPTPDVSTCAPEVINENTPPSADTGKSELKDKPKGKKALYRVREKQKKKKKLGWKLVNPCTTAMQYKQRPSDVLTRTVVKFLMHTII